MLAKRIIPCLDVMDGMVVKGKSFVDLQVVADPVAMARFYEEQGADELILLDIVASIDGRKTFLDVVERVAKELSIPFTVGGGIRSIADIRRLLHAGVDKVSINTAALLRPELITEVAQAFGSQCIVLAIDVKKGGCGWKVFSHSGTIATGRDALEWALTGQRLGVGELLVTSIDCDGRRRGYDIELMQMLSSRLCIPIIASGGVGKWEDIRDAFLSGGADAALAASLFHYQNCSIESVKKYLSIENISVRL